MNALFREIDQNVFSPKCHSLDTLQHLYTCSHDKALILSLLSTLHENCIICLNTTPPPPHHIMRFHQIACCRLASVLAPVATKFIIIINDELFKYNQTDDLTHMHSSKVHYCVLVITRDENL